MKLPSITLPRTRQHPHPSRDSRPRFRPGVAAIAVLVLLVALFYRGIMLEGLIIGDYDAFVYFYPLRQHAADMLRQGQFPLWNPYLFLGSPFFANVQTAVLYPLNLLFLAMPTPYAFSASVVIHILLAGISLYVFARRSLGISPLPSTIAAISFAFSGFISSQVGHINQINVSAWLPVLLLLFDEAVRRRSLSLGIATGLVGAFQLLAGHTQEWYFSTFVLGLFALWRVAMPAEISTWSLKGAVVSERVRPIAYLLMAGAVEAGISAVQVLPSMELSQYSIRGGGMNYGEASSFSLPPMTALYTLLPTYPSTLFSEYVGYVGVVSIMLAAFALFGWFRRPITLFMALLVVFGLFMAIGGYNPLFPMMYHHLPGVDLFRVPARWLLVYTFAASCLAGLGAQLALDMARQLRAPLRGHSGHQLRGGTWHFLVPALAVAATIVVLGILYFVAQPRPSNSQLLVWAALAAVSVAFLAVAMLSQRTSPIAVALLAIVLVAELWTAGAEMDFRHPIPFEAYKPQRTSTSFLLADAAQREDPGRLLSFATDQYEVKETPDYQKQYDWLNKEALRQFMIGIKLSEALAPNIPMEYGIETVDGYDGGILPLRRYAEFKALLLPPKWIPADNQLRTRLDYVPPTRFLDMMSVRYVLATKIQDTRIDNVYYDRGISLEVNPGQSVNLERMPSIRATSVGIISSTEGAREMGDGTPAATITFTEPSGIGHPIPLRLGMETGETPEKDSDFRPPAHRRPQLVPPWSEESKATDFFVKVSLPARMEVDKLTIQSALPGGSKLRIRAITLIDDVAATSVPLVLSDRLDRELFFDMKLYTDRSPMPRAHLVHSSAVRDDGATLESLREGQFQVDEGVMLAPSATARSIYHSVPVRSLDAARVVSHLPEEMVVEVTSPQEGYLVLQDAYFPGWTATVDGAQVPVERANYFFRAVLLEPGQHRVVFRYAPDSFRIGLWVTLASVAVLAALLLGLAVRNRRPTAGGRDIIADGQSDIGQLMARRIQGGAS